MIAGCGCGSAGVGTDVGVTSGASASRWRAHARRDNGILRAVISPEVFIHERPFGITCRTLWNWPIMAIGQWGCAALPSAAEISVIIDPATVAQPPKAMT
jgi:hypothetical protein